MSKADYAGAGVVLGMLLACGIVTLFDPPGQVRAAAVEAGAAEWYLDGKSVEFRWLPFEHADDLEHYVNCERFDCLRCDAIDRDEEWVLCSHGDVRIECPLGHLEKEVLGG